MTIYTCHLATHPLSTPFCNCFFSQTGNKQKNELKMNSVKHCVEHTRDWAKFCSRRYNHIFAKHVRFFSSQEVIKSVLHWSRVERNARTFWERFFEKRYAQMRPRGMWLEILEGGHGSKVVILFSCFYYKALPSDLFGCFK